MTADPLMECRDVRKRYGRKTVLDGVSVSLCEGEVFGFLGPNGAGKTTFIKILLGLVTPDAGSIRVFGRDLFRDRRCIMREVGAIVESPVFFEYLSAYENLASLVALNGSASDVRLRDTLDLVGLADVATRRVATFSYGMKQRLGIAQALLPASRLIVLDEPTNGLDPHGIAGIRRLVRRLTSEYGVTVLVSSHLLGEVELICDRVMIIDQGRTVLEARVDELRTRTADTVEMRVERSDGVGEQVAGFGGRVIASAVDDEIAFVMPATASEIPDLVLRAVGLGLRVRAVTTRRPTLEDVFLAQTGDSNGDVRVDAFGA